MTEALARERGLDIEHDAWTHALWDAAHQSFALRRWVSENKFGPHRVVCRTPLTNIRITTFFAGEHEVRVLDPSRVELLTAIGCDAVVEG
jgi:transposase InsO family protein